MDYSMSPFLNPKIGSQLFSLLSRRSFASSPKLDPKPAKCYPTGESPLEHALILSPFLDCLLAHLTTLDILRFTNVSQTVRAYTYDHIPSFRVLNFIRFCQESHQLLPNYRPQNGTNRLCNWEYNLPAKKYPYIDTNEWECTCKFCTCYGCLDDENEGEGLLGLRGGLLQREFYYYSLLGSTELHSLFRRLPQGIQLTVLILDGTDVGMEFVREIFRSAWGGAWLKELSLRRCAQIEHSDIEKWLRKAFSRNWVHGLRVLKLWGCGTKSPRGIFKPRYGTASLRPSNSTPGFVGVGGPGASGASQANTGTSSAITATIPGSLNEPTSSSDTQTDASTGSTAAATEPQVATTSDTPRNITNSPSMVVQQIPSSLPSVISDLNNPIPSPAGPSQNSFSGTGTGTRTQGPGAKSSVKTVDVTVTSNIVTRGPAQNTPDLLGSTDFVVGGTSQPTLGPSDAGIDRAIAESGQGHVVNSMFDAPPSEVATLAGSQNPNTNRVGGNNIVVPSIDSLSLAGAYHEHSVSGSISNATPNNAPSSALNPVPMPVSTATAGTLGIRSKTVDPTINLIRYCRQKKIYLDIGLCAMKQQCFTVRAHINANIAQNLLAAVGGVAGFAPQQRGQVVLAEKRPAKRECCKEECELVELEALCGRCVANMTCQKCHNFYCRKHDPGEHLFLLCPICGPCCDPCFEANTTSCAYCSEHFCNTHYPNGRCLIVFDLITGDLVSREEGDVIAEEARVERTMSGNSSCGRRNRKYEKCKSCKEIMCWECADEGGWEYCDSTRGGCGEMVCKGCDSFTCWSCESRFCEDCAKTMGDNHPIPMDFDGNTADLSDSECYEDDWLCVHCYEARKARKAELKKHRDMDPLAMRALFGEKFGLCEIRDIMERQDIKKANTEGWLKHVLEETDGYDMPKLIDSDEDEELMPSLIDLNGDVVLDLVGSGENLASNSPCPESHGGDTPGLAGSDENRPSAGSSEETILGPLDPSEKEMEHRSSTSEDNFDEIDISKPQSEGKDIRTSIKGTKIFSRQQSTRYYDKPDTPMGYSSCHSGIETSSSAESVEDIIAATPKRDQLEDHAEAISGEKYLANAESNAE